VPSTTCFHNGESIGFAELESLWATVRDRAANRPAGSYTTLLMDGGPARTGRKVLEEAAEVVEASIAHAEARADATRLAEEAADLIYHLLVVLGERGVSPALVIDLLIDRRSSR